MTDRPIDRLLGTSRRDAGCEGASEVLDQYVEAIHRGANLETRYADVVTHLRNCAACREDTEGLLAALDDLDAPPPGQVMT